MFSLVSGRVWGWEDHWTKKESVRHRLGKAEGRGEKQHPEELGSLVWWAEFDFWLKFSE